LKQQTRNNCSGLLVQISSLLGDIAEKITKLNNMNNEKLQPLNSEELSEINGGIAPLVWLGVGIAVGLAITFFDSKL
jgi:lactobin A/cerein 7B family class IIb bacteriocin